MARPGWESGTYSGKFAGPRLPLAGTKHGQTVKPNETIGQRALLMSIIPRMGENYNSKEARIFSAVSRALGRSASTVRSAYFS